MLPIVIESAKNFIDPIAITPIFDGLDCPQNKHYGTTAYDRRCQKFLGDRIDQRHSGDALDSLRVKVSSNSMRRDSSESHMGDSPFGC